MQVTLRTFANLRELLGSERITINLPSPITLKDFIHELIIRYPNLKTTLLTPQGQINPMYQFILNSENISIHDSQRQIQDNDTLIILPPAGGG